MNAGAAAEKRQARRVPVTLNAHCQLGTRYVREPITDLSIGGCYLRTREPVKAGASVRAAIALPWPDGPRYCTLIGSVARVVRDARGQCGIGVCFSRREIASADWSTLEAFLAIRT
jgi:hypothetical protein